MTRTSEVGGSPQNRAAVRRWGCLSRVWSLLQAGRLGWATTVHGVVQDQRQRLRPTGGPGRDVSAHQDLEGVQRPPSGDRRELDRIEMRSLGLFSLGSFALRRVRAADDPPRRRGRGGLSVGAPAADRGELPQGPRGATAATRSARMSCAAAVVRQRKATLAVAQVDLGPAHSDGEWIYGARQPLGPTRAAPCASGHEATESSFTPTYSSCRQPDRSALRAAARATLNSRPQTPTDTVLRRRRAAGPTLGCWRNANARDPDLLAGGGTPRRRDPLVMASHRAPRDSRARSRRAGRYSLTIFLRLLRWRPV